MIDFKGHRVEKDIILTCVRWYLAYPLSYRNLFPAARQQAIRWQELADGRDLYQNQGPVEVSLPRR